ncbi:MAG TPA: tetratricopeptide repeat protein, partial [Rhodocyclaceae bacterium]|nr:tetratricopeptide repeat protein [Rhodocyclaceae bacterium]
MRTRKLLAALAATLLASGAALADNPLDEARRLLDAGDGAQAYALLVPAESARAGDPAFDLLLGIAALEAGETTRAIFALERAVTVDPGNARARAELARAYLAAGETDAARREFERVRKQDVPADVKRTIDRFLSAADLLDD